MTQPHNDQGTFDGDFLDYVPEELLGQPENSVTLLSSFDAATEGSMRFSAVLPMGGSPITSSSQPVPCGNCNSNCNNKTNMTSMGNSRLVNGSTIVDSAMSLGG
jgi:hypothetical protein